MATIRQLRGTLKITFGIVPIVASLDKFTNLLTQWAGCLDKNLIRLIIGGHYFDVAVRDLVMAVGAYNLAQLTRINDGKIPSL